MLCYAMLCYAMSCYVSVLCCAVLCYVSLCQSMSYRIELGGRLAGGGRPEQVDRPLPRRRGHDEGGEEVGGARPGPDGLRYACMYVRM